MSSFDQQGRALIVGGSMAGLFTALLLHRQGWRIDIYERVEAELSERGTGIVTHDELIAAIEAAGLTAATDLGVFVERRVTFALDGSPVAEGEYRQVMTSWDRLYRLLRTGLPDGCYHRGRAATHVEPLAGGARVHFADGTSEDGDLVVGADGFRSVLRSQVLPEVRPAYAGYVGWRGMVDEEAMSPAAHKALFGCFGFGLPPGEQILGYPVAGAGNDLRPGHRRYNFVWYRPADEAVDLARLLTDSSGRRHEVSIPPPLIRPEIVDELRASAHRTLAPQFAEVVERSAMPFFQPIYDLESPTMVFGRLVLLGDAAFVARPHVGAGVTKAAEDALALARALGGATSIEAGLAAFEAERLIVCRRIVAPSSSRGKRPRASRRRCPKRSWPKPPRSISCAPEERLRRRGGVRQEACRLGAGTVEEGADAPLHHRFELLRRLDPVDETPYPDIEEAAMQRPGCLVRPAPRGRPGREACRARGRDNGD